VSLSIIFLSKWILKKKCHVLFSEKPKMTFSNTSLCPQLKYIPYTATIKKHTFKKLESDHFVLKNDRN